MLTFAHRDRSEQGRFFDDEFAGFGGDGGDVGEIDRLGRALKFSVTPSSPS